MKCPYCKQNDSRVIDSRSADDGATIRRRRECTSCGRRFTTYEKIEQLPMMVVKRDGRRELFDVEKVKAGILRSCEKLPVSMQQIEDMSARVEQRVYSNRDQEITSSAIGDMVTEELRRVNEVAYVRFASVYLAFSDVADFIRVNALFGDVRCAQSNFDMICS